MRKVVATRVPSRDRTSMRSACTLRSWYTVASVRSPSCSDATASVSPSARVTVHATSATNELGNAGGTSGMPVSRSTWICRGVVPGFAAGCT